MGKSKLRRKLSQLLGHKIYKGKRGKGLYRAEWLRTLIRRAEFVTGDIASDCDGFNHVVGEVVLVDDIRRGAVYIRNIEHIKQGDDELVPERFCHIGPPCSRSEIETRLKTWYTDKEWNSEPTNLIVKRRDALLRGEHIVDERGVLLPEYR